jgi:hydrogenase-4 component B
MLANPALSIVYAMLILAAGAIASLIFTSNRRMMGWFSFLTVAFAGCLMLWAAATTITAGPGSPMVFSAVSLWGSTLRFYLDGLGAIFLGLIAIVSILAAFYSISYMDHYADYNPGRYYPWFLLFIAGMYGIVTVTDTMVFFCVFWQLMTIPSFALIRFENRKPENVKAANKYLIVMEIACLLVMAGSAVLVYTGTVPEHMAGLPRFDFDTLREQIIAAGTSPHALFPALLLMLVGFGIKAGLWPFGQLWLPDAHPAAPSPVSALLSGVMIKTGVYGLIRTFFWLVPNAEVRGFSPTFWGGLLAIFGTITLVMGTYQALRQEQTKRLLAFHSIGQVGYIILGLGASIMLLPSGATVGTLATVALIGALFHTINHALFKSLLFFNAGTMLKATHTQDLNKLGGLFMVMPLTAITCLIASLSISGVPLFNGFASKWTIYSATILSGHTAFILPVCGLLGILTSALTLASFMKFFGITFLSRASTIVKQEAAKGAKMEAGFLMQTPQVLLAITCVFLGVFPAVGYILIARALASGPAGVSKFLPVFPVDSASLLGGVAIHDGSAMFMPILIVGVLVVLMTGAYVFSRLGSAPRRKNDIWLCGYDAEADIHRYGAHNLYGEVKHLFGKKH